MKAEATLAKPHSAAVWPAAPGLPRLQRGDRVHLVGIGGAGMSGLARALAQLGLVVSGSDRQASGVTDALVADGIAVTIGHDAARLPAGCALVVYSPAVGPDNPELVAAAAAGVPTTKRAVLLGALMDSRLGIAVAGTHGKTTSSGLMAWVLRTAGLDPTFFVGGELPDLGTNAWAGSGPHAVVEADEYDRSFLHLHPAIGIVLNVEHDHPDIYPSLDDVLDAFRAFVAGVLPDGLVVANAASPGVLDVVGAAQAPVALYHVAGDPLPAAGTAITWQATDLVTDGQDQLFDVHHAGTCRGTWRIGLAGRHNVGNALAVLAAADRLGIDMDAVRTALASYRGADRRFTVLGQAWHVTVVDDYAHHPTEIAATLAAARQRYPGRRIVVVLQPHTYSRVAQLVEAFAESLSGADEVVLTPVYAAREAPRADGQAARIAARVPGARLTESLATTAETAAQLARHGDVLLFLGAGDIPQASRDCLQRLRSRALADLRQQAARLGLGGSVTAGQPLAELTSLKVGGPAALAVRVTTTADLAAWWQLAQVVDAPVRVLGRGTNVLAADEGYQGLILVNRCEAWRLSEETATAALVTAESGVTLAALGQTLARQGWAGLEGGVGIPGSLGAGLVTNAGAHGWCMADSVLSAEIMAADGTTRTWLPAELGFRYRGSALKGRTDQLVLSLRLAVQRAAPAEILARIDEFTAYRRATQPATPSVGSMFKNPPGDTAGRLIEEAGLKGSRSGGAEISPKHANFFVNTGGARAGDVLALVRLARRAVNRHSGTKLELEIETLGDDHVE